MPVLPLWAFVACSGVNFTFTYLSLLQSVETKQQRNDHRRGRTANICASYSEVHGFISQCGEKQFAVFCGSFRPLRANSAKNLGLHHI